jgi:hypothetical protein
MKSHSLTRAALPCVLAVLGLTISAAEEASVKPDVSKHIQGLAGKYLDQRTAAMTALKAAPKEDVVAGIPQLLALMDIDDWQTQRSAAEILQSLGALGKPAIAPLVERLHTAAKNRQSIVFGLILDTLGKLGPEAMAAAKPAILGALASGSAPVFVAASRAFKDLDEVGKQQALPSLVTLIRSPDGASARLALGLLEDMGPKGAAAAKEVAGTLTADLAIADRDRFDHTARALKRLGPEGYTALGQALIPLINGDNVMVLSQLAPFGSPHGAALHKIEGPVVKDLLAALVKRLADTRVEVVAAAARGVGILGDPEGSTALVATVKAWNTPGRLNDFNTVFIHVQFAAQHLPEAAAQTVRQAAVSEKVSHLIARLRGTNITTAIEAAAGLEKLGDKATAAIEPLRVAAQSNDPRLRQAAEAAVKAIQASTK